MKYEISHHALTIETMLKTIVKKAIKKNYKNYSEEVQEEIDIENIFDSIFPNFNINDEDFQKKLGEVINPTVKNGECVKIIEASSYWRLFVEHMVLKTFDKTSDSQSISFKSHYEDILIAICKQPSFLEKYNCVRSFFEIKLHENNNRTKNLINILVNGDYEQGQRIYSEGKFSEKEFVEQKRNVELLINDMDLLVQILFKDKIEQIISCNYCLNMEGKILTSYGLKKVSAKEMEFYNNLFLQEIDKGIGKIILSIPEGLREKFINKINVFSNKEIKLKIKATERFKSWENVEDFINTLQSIFDKYRNKKLEFKLTPSVFEKLPSLSGIQYNKDIMNISCVGGSEATESLMKNIISVIKMMEHERVLFKSMRLKESKEDLQILFNFKDEILREEKENLLNSLEDMILDVLRGENNNAEWFIPSQDKQKYNLSISEIKRKFIDLNSEAFLRVKLSDVKKEEAPTRTKKKL